MNSIVAIVGRPNVGKSTLFNRLVGEREAIVDDLSGVTRDRHYGTAVWGDREFTVIDTGGYVPESDDVFEAAIREQVHIAMEEADAVLFVVDARAGVTVLDEAFSNIVRQSKKPVLLVVNKVDNFNLIEDSYEFYQLGLEELFPISAVNGQGTGELLEQLVKELPEKEGSIYEEGVPRFAVVGRPNVGKSSFINALTGKNRNIVTPIAGTTRDSLLARYTAFNHDLYLVDTAGLRKRAQVHENIEFYSTLRTVRAIENCDVGLLVIDATQGIERQDLNIFSALQKQQKGIVILVNKWDLVKKDTYTAREFEAVIKERIAPFTEVPVVFVSALEKQRILKALETGMEVFRQKEKKIPTSLLNEVMLKAIAAYHPPTHRGRFIRIKYVTQVKASVPTFLFFANHPKHVKESYKRYLENQLRKNFGFEGVPINVFFRDKS